MVVIKKDIIIDQVRIHIAEIPDISVHQKFSQIQPAFHTDLL